jgi:nucleotide-binding universal stress UspA family protein
MIRRRPISVAEAAGCRKPLLAYDGSAGAERALDVAIELASASHGRLTILSAVVQIPFLAYTGAAPEAVAELRNSLLTDAERVVCRAVKRVPGGISVTRITSARPIEEALVRETSEGDHDLLVVGSRGRGRIRSLLFGSVGRAMVRRGPLPVLIVRGAPDRLAAADPELPQLGPMTPRRA